LAVDARTRLTPHEGRRFGLTVGTALCVLAAIGLWRGHAVVPGVLAGLGVGLVLAALAVPGRLGPVYHAWMSGAQVISKVTTPLFLGIVYLLVLTPAGLLMRLLGRNPLRHEESKTGYWKVRDPGQSSSLDRQF